MILDSEKPSLKIVKTDALTGKPIAGVGFLVRLADGSTENTVVTDENGEAVLSHLNEGVYEVIEKSVPAGYLLDNNSKLVTLETGRTSVVRFENYPTPSLVINKVDSITKKPLKGARFNVSCASDNTDSGESSDLGTHYTDENGRIHLYDLQTGWYKITETEPPAGYMLSEQNAQEIYIKAGENKEVTFENTPKSALIVKKVDAVTGAVLQGAKFRVRYFEGVSGTGGTVIGEYMTSANGTIVITDLDAGTYIIEEVQAPDGYEITEPEKTVYISGSEQSSVEVEFADKPSGQVIVQKLDSETKEPLAGAEFLITTADGAYVANSGGTVSSNGYYVTDEYGQIILTGVKPGTVLVITETKAPDGYVLETNSQTVEVTENDTQTVTFFNKPSGQVIVQKLDSETKEPLAGAEFLITTADGAYVANSGGTVSSNGYYVTDEYGQIILTGIKPGTVLVITETKAPDGYEIETNSQTVEVTENDTQTVTFFNKPSGQVIVQKLDSETKEPLAGAEFLITAADGAYVANSGGTVSSNGYYVTDEYGQITLTGIKAGTVLVITETKAPDGYVLETNSQTVEVAENDTQTVTFFNKPSGQVIVQKLDSETKEPLAGAEFLITTADGAYVANSGGTVSSNGYYVTDEYGQITLTGIKPGTVLVITETKAPDGYVLETNSQTVEVAENDTQTVTFFNKPSGQVIVQKLDSKTKEPLAGAEFLITTADGAYVANSGGTVSSNGYYVTDEYGQITLTGIKAGTVLVITETKAPDGYEIETNSQTVEVDSNDTQTITFFNKPKGGLIVNKLDAHTGKPLRGAEFKITDSDGSVVGEENGKFTTDKEGVIALYGLPTGTYVVTEIKAPSGYTLDSTPQTIEIKSGKIYELTFYDEPIGGLRITKIDEETRQPIKNVEFDVEQMDGKRIGTYRTDEDGEIHIDDLPDGWYTIIEKKAAKGYILDSEPHDVEIKDGEITPITLTNRKNSAFLIHKLDSVTGEGIYGVTFLISDRNGTPIAQYTTDQDGYVYTDDRDFTDGKYYIREISVPQGYTIDPEVKTFYVEYGRTTGITWYNTPTLAQIQIIKKSADDNQINGLPAGSLLEGAVFEIYDRGGNVVDTIQTDANGRASSKALALGVYTVRETKAPAYYSVNDTVMTANLEFAGQIVSFEVADKSVHTGVSIIKTGYNEVMPDNPLVYSFKDIGNTSNVPLDSFYWRDTLSSAIRCEKLVTGTYNQQLSYKIVYRTNLSGEEYRIINDNLSTKRNYALDISPAALNMASGEYITEIMFVFGRVGAGFNQVENPYLYARTIPGLPNGSEVVNQADVGGMYDGVWITSVSRWVTKIYSYTHIDMPRTGY